MCDDVRYRALLGAVVCVLLIATMSLGFVRHLAHATPIFCGLVLREGGLRNGLGAHPRSSGCFWCNARDRQANSLVSVDYNLSQLQSQLSRTRDPSGFVHISDAAANVSAARGAMIPFKEI